MLIMGLLQAPLEAWRGFYRALSVRAQEGDRCVWLGCRPHPGHCHPPSCREQLSGCVPCPTPHGAGEDIMSAEMPSGHGHMDLCLEQRRDGHSGCRERGQPRGPSREGLLCPPGPWPGWEEGLVVSGGTGPKARGPPPGLGSRPAQGPSPRRGGHAGKAGMASGWAWVCIPHRVPLTCCAHSHAHAHMCTCTASVPGWGWGPTDSWAELQTFLQLRSPRPQLSIQMGVLSDGSAARISVFSKTIRTHILESRLPVCAGLSHPRGPPGLAQTQL